MSKSVRAIVVAIVAAVALAAAFAIVTDRAGQQMVRNDQPPAGSSGMARPHPPLDRAPGEALKTPL